MVLIGGGNSQRSASKRSTAGIRGATGSGRVEVSTAPRKADEARRRRGQNPSRCAKGLPDASGIKSVRLRLGGQVLKLYPLGYNSVEKTGDFEVADRVRILGTGL